MPHSYDYDTVLNQKKGLDNDSYVIASEIQ